MKKLLIIFSLCIILAACGDCAGNDSAGCGTEPGSATDDNDNNNDDGDGDGTPSDNIVSPAIGLWLGESETALGSSVLLAGIIDSQGRLRFMSLESDYDITASITLENDSFNTPTGAYYLDNQYDSEVTIIGDVITDTLSGEIRNSQFLLTYSLSRLDESDDQPSIGAVSGNYAADSMSIGIDIDGVVTGSDSRGCLLTGQMSIPDRKHNTYDLSLTVENCEEFSGSYSGLAAKVTIEGNSGLLFSLDGGIYVMSDYLLKSD